MKRTERKLKIDRKGTSIENPLPLTKEKEELIKKLEENLKQEREKREKLEQHLISFRLRALKREKEFFKILDKNSLNKISTIKDNAEIQAIYTSIVHNFDEANEKTHHMLEKKYKLNYEFMERRIKQILEHMGKELFLHKQLSHDDAKKVKNTIDDVLRVAKEVQEQNIALQKQVHNLKFKNSLLRDERNLMLEEVIDKKNKIVEISKKFNKLKHQNETSLRQNRTQERLTLQTQAKFIGEPAIQMSNKSTPQNQKGRKYLKSERKNYRSNSENWINNERKNIVKEMEKQKQLEWKINQLERRDKEITHQLEELVRESKQGEKVKLLTLVKIIKELKKRLARVENPIEASGWDHQYHELLCIQL